MADLDQIVADSWEQIRAINTATEIVTSGNVMALISLVNDPTAMDILRKALKWSETSCRFTMVAITARTPDTVSKLRICEILIDSGLAACD